MTQTVILRGRNARELACHMVCQAPDGFVCQVKEPKRTSEQNDKMWAMLSDISRAKPEGRRHTPDDWKAIFMNACGWEVQFIEGLDGRPFPSGLRSSQLTKKQMMDLITFIQAKGDEWGVVWTDPQEKAA